MKYEPVIGLEIHAALKTKTKMFCACKNDSDEHHPNVNICPVCTGQPGTLPVINEEAINSVIKVGLALKSKVSEITKWDRKNYFYPDLPKGYQISQYDNPICSGGYLNIPGSGKKVKIRRIHLEEDTGRLIHFGHVGHSLVDFNRAGVPLMELVTEPDLNSGEEASAFAEELQLILRYLGVSDADMEKGALRIEANVSIRPNKELIKTNGKRIVLKEESYQLMKLIFEVHNKLGSIYKEKNYQDAIEEILKRENISYEREKNISLKFENLEISNFFADFIVDNKILLEVKATKFITQEDIRQVLRYIKSAELPLGIVVNFRRNKLEYKRLINPKFDHNSFSFDRNSSDVTLGTKVEIKNLNSFKAARNAIDYEIKRQAELLEHSKKIIQETRGWNESKGETVLQRIKEESHDYRYFPEPDLPPLKIDFGLVEKLKTTLGELPQDKRDRFKKQYGLTDSQINILVNNEKLSGFFENVASELINLEAGNKKELFSLSANYILGDFLGFLNEASAEVDDIRISAEDFAEWVGLIYRGVITSRAAKEVLKEMWATGKDPSQIIEEKNLIQIKDTDVIEQIASKVIAENPKAVEDYKKGKEASLQFLVGQVMKETCGKVNPTTISSILKNLINKI